MAAAYGLGGVFVYAACTTPPPVGVIPTVIQPGTTSVSVDPSVFLGAVECSTQQGGMQSYVATAKDETVGFTLASSPPTACSQSAYFEDIIAGDAFTASVDGYDVSADLLVPACGASPPGAAQPCTSNDDCAPAYGCPGRCLVSLFVNEDYSCLQNCLFQTDAGTPTQAEVDAFASCIATPNPQFNPQGDCASSLLDDPTGQQTSYLGCVRGCGAATLGAAFEPGFEACVTANNDCLLSDIPVLQTECPTAPPRQDGGIPADGVPDGGLNGAGDLVLTGEVQACTCFYAVAEGDRNMYQRMKNLYCQQDSDCCYPGLPCPQGTCHAVEIGGQPKKVCRSIPAQPRWQTTTPASGSLPAPLCGQQQVIGATQRSCTRDADCPTVGDPLTGTWQDSCTDGFCTPAKPRPCFSDLDCSPGRLCVGGYCDPTVVAYTNTPLTPCSVGDNQSDAGITEIQVVPGALLASSAMPQPGAPVCLGPCNSAANDGGTGNVTDFDVVPADPSLTPATGLGCCAATVTFANVVPNHQYAFTVLAHDGSGTAAYSACCFATARAGVEITAMCDPLTPVGAGGPPTCQ